MIRRNLFKLPIIIFLALSINSTQVLASITNVSNNFKNYVEPVDNVVKGESVKYTFFMPEAWRNKVNAYRQSGQAGDNYLEKVSFYYSPSGSGNVVNKSNESLFLTITVYASGQKIQSSAEKVIFTQNDYTFTSRVSAKNDYKEVSTRNEFNKIITNAKDTEFLKKYLVYNNTNSSVTSSKVYYKNSTTTSNSYIDSNGVVYIPLRDFSNAMNYKIVWYESIKGVKMTKNGVSDIIYQNSKNSAYQTKMINNKMYISTNYLRDKWNVSVYIDNKSNVYIS